MTALTLLVLLLAWASNGGAPPHQASEADGLADAAPPATQRSGDAAGPRPALALVRTEFLSATTGPAAPLRLKTASAR